MELVGDRWALLILRELILGPRRFSDIRADLPGISANVLTQRLTELEASHIVHRLRLPPPANVQVYGLTEWGHEAEPMVLAIARWAYRSPTHDRMKPLTANAMLLSLVANADRAKIGSLALRLHFAVDGRSFAGTLDATGLTIAAGDAAAPDLAYAGTARGLASHFYGKVPIDALERQELLSRSGDPAVAARFANLFHLPGRFQPASRQHGSPPA